MEKRQLRKILVILLAISLIFQLYKVVTLHYANNFVKQVSERFEKANDNFTAIEKNFSMAKKKHLTAYLKDFSLDIPKKELTEAKNLLEKARKSQHPVSKVKLAKEALEKIKLVNQISGKGQDYFQLLDQALANYQTAPEKLKQNIASVRSYISELENNDGYFAKNFEEALRLLVNADSKVSEADNLSLATRFEGNMPDYLGVYKTTLMGEEITKNAKEMAAGIPALRASNEERIKNLRANINSVLDRYEKARFAANQLEQYPSYRCMDELEKAFNYLNDLESILSNAINRNSMEVQLFKDASQALSEAEGKLNSSFSTFSRIVNKWSEVESAIFQLSSARSEAESQIRRTNSYISSWSENYQGTAQNYVNRSNDKISEGDRLQNSDPLASLNCYKEAQELAKNGYNAVDDIDHTIRISSSDDDDDGGPSIFGGSNSDYDSSGSSSDSWSSGSDSGSPGGSYDSGPSGSYDSGPSGSFDSGDDGF